MSQMELRLAALIVTVLVNTFLAAVVYKNNRRSATNIIFGLLSLVTSLWLIDVYLSVDPHFFSHAILWVRLSIFFAAPQIALFLLLAHTLPSDHLKLPPGRLRLLLGVVIVLMADSLGPFVFTKVQVTGSSVQAFPGPGLAAFGIFALTGIISAVVSLYKKLKHSTGYAKEQYRYVLAGLILMLSLLFLTVLLPVAIFKNNAFVPLVPVYTVIFLGTTTYAIVKTRLFDVRLAVARSVTYLLITATMTLAYGALLFLVIDTVFPSTGQEGVRQVLSAILITPLALSFTRTKRFFDKVTNRLFYQDAYDPQAFLDYFNKVLVSTYELVPLLKKSAEAIEYNLKPSFTMFDIKATANTPRRILGTEGHPAYNENTIASVRNSGPRMHRKVIVADFLGEKEGSLKKALQDNGISVIARLASSNNGEDIGYVVLGAKKSGNMYSQQDIRVIEIVANELVVAIQNALHTEEIENFNVTLQSKVNDATKNLRRANEKLKELDETKDDFISMASHQLRTPLTSVKGYISMVLEGDAGKLNITQRKLLEQSFFSSQRMVYLIADLLNVSRLKTGKFVIEPIPVNLADMVEQEMEQLKETAAGKDLTLTYEKPKEFPVVMLDETKTRQVIMNFIDNALYYTSPGGHIQVELRETPASVELRVTDDGIGVPKAEQHHLFTKFYRAGNARKARPDGTGLGLFMAKKVVVAQGGAVIFESQEGKGSTFGFTFSKAGVMPTSVKAPTAGKTLTPIAK